MQTVRTPEDAIEEIFGELEWFYGFDLAQKGHGVFLGVHKKVVVCLFFPLGYHIYFNMITARLIFHSDLRNSNENKNAHRTLINFINQKYNMYIQIENGWNEFMQASKESLFNEAQMIYDTEQ